MPDGLRRIQLTGSAMSDGNAWGERTIRDAVLAGDAGACCHWYDAHFE